MKTLRFLISIFLIVLTIPVITKAQYRLQNAFPNLPNFESPLEVVNAGDGSNRLFVVQQRGIIYVINNSPSVSIRKTFINLSNKVSQSGSEAGLLGLGFHPNYINNRYFYVNYTFDSASALWSRVSRFTSSPSNPDTALSNTELILITLSQPFPNHNGGKVAFGPDGYLYLSFGDGGSGGDPFGNGQNIFVLWGKILRINVDSSSPGKNYSIPVSNPFYANPNGYKEEIYAYGLRNTWRFSFDVPTNRLWAGDVGQANYEEVDIIENGKNYGWNKMEGYHCYGTCDTAGRGFTRPIWEYDHNVGISITGGYVYRGALLPGLYGKYIYGDYGSGTVWALTYNGINPATNTTVLDSNFLISAFGVDENKELYVCRIGNTTGMIFRIVNFSAITLNLKLAIEGFYNLNSLSLNINDTVRAYLRQSTMPYNVVDSSKTVIDSLTLSGLCFFNNAPSGNYYLQVKHRNGLETWSSSGGNTFSRGPLNNYDFTTASSKAYGNNQKLKGGIYCIYSGDADQNGAINADDNSMVDNDAYNYVTGFQATDLNADGTIDAIDLSIVDVNSYNFVILMRP